MGMSAGEGGKGERERKRMDVSDLPRTVEAKAWLAEIGRMGEWGASKQDRTLFLDARDGRVGSIVVLRGHGGMCLTARGGGTWWM